MGREPWLAVNLSLFFPGIGQWYLGRRAAAVAFLVSQLLLIGLACGLILAPDGDLRVAIACVILMLVVWVSSLIHAHRSAVAANPPEFETERKADRDPWLAVLLTRILPGLGHLHLRKFPVAMGFVVGFVLLGVLVPLHDLLEPLVTIYVALVGWHAYRAAPVRRESDTGWIGRITIAIVAVWLFHVGAVLALRAYVAQAFTTTSGSMNPALVAGDRFFVWKWGRDAIERGDIVVFPFPQDPSKEFVDRVIGLPGERVEIRDKQVRIDGVALEEPYVVHSDPAIRPGDADLRDNFGPFTVPAGELFVMGDNRDNANDSRYWGTVAASSVKGIAYRIYWPLSRAGRVR